MKQLLLIFAFIACLGANAQTPLIDIKNVHAADSTRFVSNPDGVLSQAAVDSLDREIAGIWRRTTAEPVVVVVGKLQEGYDIDTYATLLFEKWGIGKKDRDNGLLMVVARDDRKAVIRTGTGMEGVMTDVICGRILRNLMFPEFRNGDYDRGVMLGMAAIDSIISRPENAAEILSSIPNNARKGEGRADGADLDEFLSFLWGCLGLAVAIGIFTVCFTVVLVRRSRKGDQVLAYNRLDDSRALIAVFSFLSLGIGLIGLSMVKNRMRQMRQGPRKCPNCGTLMNKIDEVHDNDYLTPAQDLEEKLNSVDYDVWVCPHCNETDILPYINRKSRYSRCGRCGARAATLTADRIVAKATHTHAGRGERIYTCRNCGAVRVVPYSIPMLATPVIIGGGGGGGIGGGGFGGSFGGGITSGGGASGGW